ncbi:MAG: hypothetical protein ACI94Y_002660 [Maribacter sp.]|jgi:hypothetical protein
MHSNVEQIRQQKLAHFCQVILIEKDGNVVESCDSIFNTSTLTQYSVSEWFPFIESVFYSLEHLKVGDAKLLFSKVEEPAPFLQGYYDFSFSRIEMKGKEYILWELFDYTTLYEDFKKYQQKRNELEIQRQLFEIENKKLKSKDEIHERHRINASFDKKNLTPYNALQMALEAIQSFPFKDESGKPLDSLESISTHLEHIIQELPEKETDLGVGESRKDREFSLDNLLYDAIPYISTKNIDVVEASVAEDLPNRLFGNPLDLKRIIVGLAHNTSHFYEKCSLKILLYLEDMTPDSCIVGIKVETIEGLDKNPDIINILLRLTILKRIVELHQGKIKMEIATDKFGSKITCHIPFLFSQIG